MTCIRQKRGEMSECTLQKNEAARRILLGCSSSANWACSRHISHQSVIVQSWTWGWGRRSLFQQYGFFLLTCNLTDFSLFPVSFISVHKCTIDIFIYSTYVWVCLVLANFIDKHYNLRERSNFLIFFSKTSKHCIGKLARPIIANELQTCLNI